MIDWARIVEVLTKEYGSCVDVAAVLDEKGIPTDPSTIRYMRNKHSTDPRKDRAVWMYLKAKEIENNGSQE